MNYARILERARKLILLPEEEWKIIATEKTNSKKIWRGFNNRLLILVAISSLTGGLIFHTYYGFNFSFVFFSILENILVGAGTVYFSSLVVNEISSRFESKKDLQASVTLVSYSATAFYLSMAAASILNIPPLHSLLSLCGIYSFYLFWLGLTPMLGTPPQRKTGFAVLSILFILGINLALHFLLGAIFSGPLSGKGL